MSDEEKIAILELKDFKKDNDCKFWIGENGVKAVDVILNLIENQQQRIQDLEEINKEHQKENGKLREEVDELKDELADTVFRKDETISDIETDYNVLKIKIKEEIERIKSSSTYNYCGSEWSEMEVTDMLEELLEEE